MKKDNNTKTVTLYKQWLASR